MLATASRRLFNGFSASAFAQNVGLVAITGIKSRFVVAAGGVILVFLGLFPILGALVAAGPPPGARRGRHSRCSARSPPAASAPSPRSTSTATPTSSSSPSPIGMGIIPIAVPTFYDKFPSWFTVIFDSGITRRRITAVLLNIVFNIIGRPHETRVPDLLGGARAAAISEADEARLDPTGPAARGESHGGNP